MGSVKDLEVIKRPTNSIMGIGRFHFSDRYSVFDWGEMPDQIDRKGEGLCMMGAYCFEKLMEENVETHYRGLVTENGKVVTFEELEQPTAIMEVNLVNVFRPETRTINGKLEYNYDVYTPNLKNCLIPLEIIYRNGLPQGSSIFKRLEQGLITIADLGLTRYPKPGEHLSHPIFDVSTKLEDKDRYTTWKEAQEIAKISDEELNEIKTILMKVDKIITRMASRAGLENEDGKIELAFDQERKLMVVDVVGTLDECRFTHNGLHVSKETAREFYRKTPWYNDVEEAKKTAETKQIDDWKKICKSQPPRLDPTLKSIISKMYMATTNETTNRKFFDTPSLAQVIKEYREYNGEKK
jgi:phosphoribosylaminoimidazole-succinocarboxamide synthase